MKSNWFRTSVASIAALIVAFAVVSSYAANNNSKQPAKQLPKLIDLGATKCIPCKMMVPILDELSKDYKGQLDVQFIDVWKNPKAGKEYKINIIPTQIFYDAKGRELFRHQGLLSKEDVLAKWKELGVKLTSPARDAEREAQAPKPR